MYTEQKEIINSWKKYLVKIEAKMKLTIKTILDDSKNFKKIYAMFFEYEYDYMDILFYAIDNKEKILLKNIDISNELNCEHLFPKDLMEKQIEIDDKYDGEDDDFDEFSDKYTKEKEEIFENWFIECWDKIKDEYKNIPKTFFSIHDTNYKIDLNTKQKIKYDEIIK